MQKSENSWIFIRSNASCIVKPKPVYLKQIWDLSIVLGLFLSLWDSAAFADVKPNYQPKIRVFPIRVLKRSNNAKVYLISHPTEINLEENRIILLKRENKNVMAFIIRKIYPSKSAAVLRKIKKYSSVRYLEVGESYEATESIGTALNSSDSDPEMNMAAHSKPKPYDSELDEVVP